MGKLKFYTACFIGHRHINKTPELITKIKNIVEDLIVNKNIDTFLFGSKSEFNSVCHIVVTQLMIKYPNIKRCMYTCKSEHCVKESERYSLEKTFKSLINKDVHLLSYEFEIEFKHKNRAGKSSYLQRNYAMINDSNVCIFYYDYSYRPKADVYDIIGTNSKSGTALAYKYAKQKNKDIINVFNLS